METIKKILIPNDFNVKSLILVIEAMEKYPDHQFDIVLVHGLHPPTGISDLLFFNPYKAIRSLETQEFIQARRLIENRYQSRIKSLTVDVITSSSRAYFRNYLSANQFDEILYSVDLELEFKGSSFDITPLFSKCSIPVTEIRVFPYREGGIQFSNQLADLFLPVNQGMLQGS